MVSAVDFVESFLKGNNNLGVGNQHSIEGFATKASPHTWARGILPYRSCNLTLAALML